MKSDIPNLYSTLFIVNPNFFVIIHKIWDIFLVYLSAPFSISNI